MKRTTREWIRKAALRWAGKARHACRNLLGLKAGKGL